MAAVLVPCVRAEVVGTEATPVGVAQELEALLATAETLRSELKWTEALDTLRQVVARAVEDPSAAAAAQVRIGRYLLDKGDAAAAEPELLAVSSKFRDQPEAIERAGVELCSVYCALGRKADALRVAETLMSSPRPDIKAWALLKATEAGMEGGSRQDPVPQLADLSQRADCPEVANWARIRLAEVSHYRGLPSEALRSCTEVISANSTGLASKKQAAWALIWMGRVYRSTHDFDQAEESLSMASALAQPSEPELATIAEFELGETCRTWANLERPWGQLHITAMQHYESALHLASLGGSSESTRDYARLQLGSQMRHLGMREKGIAVLRLGIADPAKLTDHDRLLSERLASFMSPGEKEAWQTYLTDPAAQVDPTAAFVRKELGAEPAQPSPIVTHPSERWYWLGKLYLKQKQYEAAFESYKRADLEASQPVEHARALSGLAQTKAALATLYSGSAGHQARQEGLALARRAATYWQDVVWHAPTADLHGGYGGHIPDLPRLIQGGRPRCHGADGHLNAT